MKTPPSEMVGVAWLNALSGLDAPAATSLPSGTAWSATGFVVVEVVGTGHMPDVPSRVPIFRCHAWALASGSSNAPYSHASGIAGIIWSAAMDGLALGPLVIKPGFARALVQSTWPVSELQRIPDPDASRAHYVVDIGLRWVPLPD